MFEEIKALLVKELGVEESLISPEAELVTDLGINSLELADLVMLCEDKFDVEIEEEKLHEFINVGDVVNYLESIEK